MTKWKRMILVAVVLLVLLGIGGKMGYDWWNRTYIVVDEQVLRRDVTALDFYATPVAELEKLTELTELETLDLRETGLTAEEYEFLTGALPECTVLWSVPFQDGYFGEETTELTVTSLSMADLERLEYLPKLTTLHAEGCKDYETIMALKEAKPELEIFYSVSIGGKEYRENTAEMTVNDADVQELTELLAYLPALETVIFAGTVPENEQIYTLMQQYPDVTFVWDFELYGVPVNSLDTKLILSDIPMESVEIVENALKYFYNLEWVEMCGCGIPSEEMDALWKRHPETRFVWTVKVGVCELRTDIQVFMPYQYGYDGYSKLFDKHMAEMKYCVDIICMDMGHMGISDYSFLEYMPNMKYLILADTDGTDFSVLANLKELVFLELFMTTFDQAEVLTGLTKLEDLNLGNCAIDNVEPLKEMTWLKRLWLTGSRNVWNVERLALREALPDTIVNFSGNGSTDEGWRESPNYYAMRDLLNMDYFD